MPFPIHIGAQDVDDVIDIDRLYSQEFSDFIEKRTLSNPILRMHNTLVSASDFLLRMAHNNDPTINLTLCSSDGQVLLDTANQQKIGRVCYLAMCGKLAFFDKLREGKRVCTQMVGDQLLGAAENNTAYVIAYPIFGSDNDFVGYLTGGIASESLLPACDKAVSELALIIAEYNRILEKQIQFRRAVMDNVHGCVLVMHETGSVLEYNASFEQFIRQNGLDAGKLNFFSLLPDRDGFVSCVLKKESGKSYETMSEFRLKADKGVYQCRVLQCEQVLSSSGESSWLLCFELLGFFPYRTGGGLTFASMETHFGHLHSRYESFNNILRLCEQVAPKKINVLIQGESGTGKDVLAHAIHRASLVSGPFVSLNCGAIEPNLFLSELFGYDDGAFTGARRGGKIGKIEAANNGTLFLDEIGEMPLESQASLLKFLDNQAVVKLGGTRSQQVNVRILAATNRDLAADVRAGRFREDLYYRLNVLNIVIPPMRERADDIPDICRNILRDLSEKHGEPAVSLDSSCDCLLKQYSWPGNIRELKNVLELAFALAEDHTITLPLLQEIMDRKCKGVFSTGSEEPKNDAVGEDRLLSVLEQNRWKISAAAKQLGISRTTLYKKMEDFGIRRPKRG